MSGRNNYTTNNYTTDAPISFEGATFAIREEQDIHSLAQEIVDKNLDSRIGFRGICKKVLTLMLVGVANIVDVHIVGTGSALRSAVICFYLSNEALSLFENAAHLGLPVPDKLRDILSQLHNRSDKEDKGDGA